MALKGKAKRAIQEGVDNLKPFNVGNVRGELVYGPGWGTGRLEEPFLTMTRDPWIDYVIYSYGTPIAWHRFFSGWFSPPVGYSVTTTNHQNVVRTAIDNPGFYADARW